MAEVFRIEYETDSMFYKAHIAAIDMEEAVKYLKSKVKKRYKITSTADLCRLDAVTEKAKPTILIEGIENKQNITPEKIVYSCPWCKETFDTEQGLKIHIGRTHK